MSEAFEGEVEGLKGMRDDGRGRRREDPGFERNRRIYRTIHDDDEQRIVASNKYLFRWISI